MSCTILNAHGAPSDLYLQLLDIAGQDENKAREWHSYLLSSSFIEMFGNYVNEIHRIPSYKLDDAGEPKLFEDNGRYYFIGKNDERIYYPFDVSGLQGQFSINEIRELAKSLALHYYANNVEFDFDNLEFVQSGESIEDYVPELVRKLTAELLASDDLEKFGKGVALQTSEPFINEWVRRVKDFYNALSLVPQETDEDELIFEETATRDDLMRKESFLISAKNNVSNNVKLLLSLMESDQKNSFGMTSFVSFDEIYANLNTRLANIVPIVKDGVLEDPYDLYVEEITKLVEYKPHFKKLLEILKSDVTDTFKNQFVSAFDLHKNNFIASEIIREDEGLSYTVRNISEISSRKAAITSQWFNAFKQTGLNAVAKKKAIDRLILIRAKTLSDTTFAEAIEELRAEFNRWGIEHTTGGLEFYLGDNPLANLTTLVDGFIRGLESNIKNDEINLFRDQSAFKELAAAEAFFFTEGSDASVYTLGKSKWVYSYPSYLSKKIEEWKKDINILLSQMEATPYNQVSYYMRKLIEDPAKLEQLQLMVFDSVGSDKNGVDNHNISYLDMLSDLLHKTLAYRKGAPTYSRTPLAGDKTTSYQINYGGLNVNANMDNNDRPSELVLDIFYNYFKGEYMRMAQVHREIALNEDLILNYHTGLARGKESQLFPELNPGVKIEGVELYDENGVPVLENLDQFEDTIKDKIAEIISNRVTETEKILRQNGINSPFMVDSTIWNTYGQNKLRGIAADLWVNSTIANVEFAKMFGGDTAFYKNNLDYKKRVPGTYTDGLYPTVRDENGDIQPYFRAAIIDAVEIPMPTLNDMKEILSPEVFAKYREINAADAQAWITPERWRDIMKGLGKWSSNMESIYEKMISLDDVQFEPSELKILAQPLKGVYFDLKDNYRPVYLKYSQAVLLPRFVKGTPLESLLNTMRNSDIPIDEVITVDGIKVGSPVPVTAHTVEGDLIENLDLTSSTIELRNDRWKLQQDLPTKGIKERLIGSQIQKNIFQGIVHNLEMEFDIEGKKYTGDQLIDHINEVYTALTDIGMREVLNEFGVDDNFRITNEKAMYRSMITQLRKRGDVPDNVIEALEKGISPYGIPGYQELFQNIFSSVVNDRIIKLKTNGAGLIQMSDFGLTFDEAKKSGIKLAPWFKDKALRPPHMENGKVVPGGIFISGTLIAKHIPNWKSLSSEELFNRIDPEILQNIIGYRIPNQSLASNDALQVMGILPEGMGDTIIPYIGMTKKTGSDFDIDKMYIMMPSFKVKGGRLEYIPFKKLDGSKESLQNRIIEIYKAVLTHPDLINQVMDPIDIDYIEKDIKDLLPDMSEINHFDALADIELRKIYQQGKAGLGQNVNSLVDVARGSMAELFLSTEIIPFVNSSPVNPGLDPEFSEELSDAEIKVYKETFRGDLTISQIKKIKLFTAHMGYVNGFVDIAKDDYVVRGNWTTWSNPVGFMLLRVGAHPFLVNAFMAQPIIREYSRFRENLDSVLNRKDNKTTSESNKVLAYKIHKAIELLDDLDLGNNVTLKDVAKQLLQDRTVHKFISHQYEEDPYEALEKFIDSLKKRIIKKYNLPESKALDVADNITGVLSTVFIDPSFEDLANFKELRLGARAPSVNKDNIIKQMSLLDLFVELKKPAKNLSDSVRASRIDVDGKGRNITSHTVMRNLLEHILYFNAGAEHSLNGFRTKLYRNEKPTMLGSAKESVIDNIGYLMMYNPKYFLHAKLEVVATFNYISQMIKGQNLIDSELADKLNLDYYNYIMSGFFQLTQKEREDIMSNVPKELDKIKKLYPDNLFLKELYTVTSEGNTSIQMTKVRKTVSYRNDLIDGWRELFELNPEFAEKLVKYTYVSTGFKRTLSSFHDYIPHEYFTSNRFNYFMQGLAEREDIVDMTFVDQWMRNNGDEYASWVPRDRTPITNKDRTGQIIFATDKRSNYLLVHRGMYGDTYYKYIGDAADDTRIYVKTNLLDGSSYSMADKNLQMSSNSKVITQKDKSLIEIAQNVSKGYSIPKYVYGIEETLEDDPLSCTT